MKSIKNCQRLAKLVLFLLFVFHLHANAEEVRQTKNDIADLSGMASEIQGEGGLSRGDSLARYDGVEITLKRKSDKTKLKADLKTFGLLKRRGGIFSDGGKLEELRPGEEIDPMELDRERSPVLKEIIQSLSGPSFKLYTGSPVYIPLVIEHIRNLEYVERARPSQFEGGGPAGITSLSDVNKLIVGEPNSKAVQKELTEALNKIFHGKASNVTVDPISEDEFCYLWIVRSKNLIIPGNNYWEYAQIRMTIAPIYLTKRHRIEITIDYEWAPSSNAKTPPSDDKFRALRLRETAPILNFVNALANSLEDLFSE